LFRYRGKYDHEMNSVRKTKDFNFKIHVFGKNGKIKNVDFDFGNDDDYSIPNHEFISKGIYENINNGEIGSLTVDGYVHLHCYFNKVDD